MKTFHSDFLTLTTQIHQIAMVKLKEVVTHAKNGNELPFNDFLKQTFRGLQKQLITLTQSESKAQDVFIEAMQKFWERFVIEDNELPKNPKGYIFTTCKNICRMEKRNKWSQVILKDSFSDSDFYRSSQEEIPDEMELKKQSLAMAMRAISDKCKQLMELSMDASVKLVDCLEILGFETYQALVQAKYNCKKRLTKEVFIAYYKLKKTQQP